MRDYNSLLPLYLRDGVNIRKHGDILDAQNKKMEENVEYLENLYNLKRPILIERVQEEPYVCTIKVHVNTRYPIRFILIDDEVMAEYEEEDGVTTTIVEKEYSRPSGYVSVVMPELLVTVETYNDRVYTKGYPENDEVKGDECDHDEAIDIVGNLLGIPRRVYKDVDRGFTPASYADTYPTYFTKNEIHRWLTDTATEDDYYYSQRLQKFLDGLNRKDFVVHMAEVLYEWNDSSVWHCENRDSYLYPEIEEIISETPVFDLLVTRKQYSNMDYSNISEVMRGYYPITRILILLAAKLIDWGMESVSFTSGVLSFVAWGEFEDGDEVYELVNCIFDVEFYNARLQLISSEELQEDDFEAVYSGDVVGGAVFVRVAFKEMYECQSFDDYKELVWLITPLTSYHYALPSEDNLVASEGADTGFTLSNWSGNGIRTINSNGTLELTRTTGGNNYYNIPFPLCDFVFQVDFERRCEIQYVNTIDGGITFTGNNHSSIVERDTVDGVLTSTKTTSVDPLRSDSKPRNTLTIQRTGNNLTFRYRSNTNDSWVEYTRHYPSIEYTGRLNFFLPNEANITIHSIGLLQLGTEDDRPVISRENSITTFSTTNWRYTNIPQFKEDNSIVMQLGNSHYNIDFPDGDWSCVIKMENYGNGATFSYYNSVDGNFSFAPRKTSSILIEYIVSGGTQTETSRYNGSAFTSDDGQTNTLTIQREGNVIKFIYENTLGVEKTYTRTYNDIHVNGHLMIYGYGGDTSYSLIKSISILSDGGGDNMITLPTYYSSNWTFTSRGTDSTTPTINPGGTVEIGRYTHHKYNPPLDKTKQYDIYFYVPNTSTAMYIGVGDENSTPLSNYQASTGYGAIEGINKATIKYDGTRWIFTYNNTTYYNLSTRDTVYLLISCANTTTVLNNRILAITEQTNGGGAISMIYNTINTDNLNNGFTLSNWTYSTAPEISNDGMKLINGTYNYQPTLPTGNWKLIITTKVYGYGGTIQYNNSANGLYRIRPNGTNPLLQGYDSSGTEIIRETPDTFIANDGDTNTLIITKQNNTITFSYINTNGEEVSYPRTYTELTQRGRIAIVDAGGDNNYLQIQDITLLEEIETETEEEE